VVLLTGVHHLKILHMNSDPEVLVIREATTEDLQPITDIYADAVLNTVATLDTVPPTLESRADWLQHHGGRFPVIVAVMDGTVVGWASLSVWNDRGAYTHTAESSVYVSRAHRRRGIGASLLASIETRARRLNYHVIIARVVASNETSLKLVHAAGYEDVGIIREVGYKFGTWLDMCVLQLILPCTPEE
jgi:phosphinothricin acetyltransferase